MMLSKRFSLLIVTAIVLADGPGLATLPATVRIDAGLVSGVAGATANMRVFKGIPHARVQRHSICRTACGSVAVAPAAAR